MSDNSEIAPMTPLRNSPRHTPCPSPPTLPIPVPVGQSSFFATSSPSPINHTSPSFLTFSPRPIPTFLPQPAPQQGHSGETGAVNQQEDNVLALLSNLRVDNLHQSSLLQAQAELIALLTAQARQDKSAITSSQAEAKNIKDVFHDELMKNWSASQEAIAHLQGGKIGKIGGCQLAAFG
ncbi:hypothetical protein PTTG_04335 [Puccinia triticina 1-1 BBBD Race 1]|uniref:Uncharacterized protein n=1 Tax=Puccinia triticina (isolate 1-1 / race 1 (BBBD)) TaxID=630390 RepID=A0A0C4EU56_PUCT1|nr:hypothetical protein PTTG_04335 [Puccinia triticina 1-1 BBBD Race 1]